MSATQHSSNDLPDIVSGLTQLEWRVLQAVPRDTYTKTTRVLRAAVGKDVESLLPYIKDDRWMDADLVGGEHACPVAGLAEFAALQLYLSRSARSMGPIGPDWPLCTPRRFAEGLLATLGLGKEVA